MAVRLIAPLFIALTVGLTVNGPILATGAVAQNFFERLFGVAPRNRAGERPAGSRRDLSRPRDMPLWQPNGTLRGSAFGPPAPASDGHQSNRRPSHGGRYRTMCVRMCDGYFFPVSFSARRTDLQRDANVCSRRCPGQGKLFFVSSPRGELDDARARDGQRYAKLATAFLYRKERVSNCACRPEPWEHSERLRHAMYAGKTSVSGGLEVVAGDYSKRKTTEDVRDDAAADGLAADEATAKDDADASTIPDARADDTPSAVHDTADGDAEKTVRPAVAVAPIPPARTVTRRAPRAVEARQSRTRRQGPDTAQGDNRTRRATIFPFLAGPRNQQMRFPGD